MVEEEAYATCLRLASQHYENFPVASRLLPKAVRPHIAAIYAFARIADDFADEGDVPHATRIALLEGWQRRLYEAASGQVDDDGTEAAHVFTALGATMRRFNLEIGLFEDLLSAFCQDVLVKRYETWDELLDYCRRSANPVGRLVLRIHGYRDARLDHYSDAICTALQLTNFWQDLAEDWRRGRLYMPRALVTAAEADQADLARGVWSSGWRSALSEAGWRTRQFFEEGRPLPDSLTGRLRFELRATWIGGMNILERLEESDYDVFHRRPKHGFLDAASILWRTALWR